MTCSRWLKPSTAPSRCPRKSRPDGWSECEKTCANTTSIDGPPICFPISRRSASILRNESRCSKYHDHTVAEPAYWIFPSGARRHSACRTGEPLHEHGGNTIRVLHRGVLDAHWQSVRGHARGVAEGPATVKRCLHLSSHFPNAEQPPFSYRGIFQ